MENDARLLQKMRRNIEDLEDKYQNGDFETRQEIEPKILELVSKSASLRLKILQGGIVITDDDLDQMEQIRDDIRKAAEKQAMLLAIARTVAFIGARI